VYAVLVELFDTDLIDLLLFFSRPFFAIFLGYFFMCKLIPNRLKMYQLIIISVLYALWFNLRIPALYGTSYHLWMNVFVNALTFAILIFLFQGRFWKRFIVYWYFQIIQLMCETISFVPVFTYYSFSENPGSWSGIVSRTESIVVLRLIYTLVVILLFLFLGYLSLIIWRRLLLRRFHPFYLLFIALPIGQMYSLSNVVNPGMGDWFFGITFMIVADAELSYSILSVLGAAVCLFASIALFGYILSHDKRAGIEAEIKEIRRAMDLEQSRYREIEQQSEEVAKLRHDFNNQLASILQLMRAGEDEAAREMIDALSKEIMMDKEDTLYNYPVIRTVLDEKSRICEDTGISLSTDLYLPASLAVEQIHLCSMFDKLLDNAISVCKRVMAEGGQPAIRLSSMTDGDYLFIKAACTSIETPESHFHSGGYGNRVLSDLSARYSGDYRTELKDGFFTAVISLLAVQGEKD